jgi:hypothetical protein
LTLADITAVAEVSASAPESDAVFSAVAALAQKAIGFRLFTIMRLHTASAEVERLYSSHPDAYPVSGRKPKQGTPWDEQVSTVAKSSSPTHRTRCSRLSPITS